MEPFESSGLWWLPEEADEQVVGLLKYSDAEGFALSIPFGHLGGFKHMAGRINRTERTPVVHGTLRSGKRVTLVDLLMTNMQLNMPGAGREEYYAGLGFLGSIQAEVNPRVDTARFKFTHLRDWVVDHRSTSRHGFDEGKPIQIVDYHYEGPELEELASGDGRSLLLHHTALVPFASMTGFNLTHDCEIELRLARPLDFEKLSTDLLGPLWQFLVFCLDRGVNTTSVRIHEAESEEWLDVGRHRTVWGGGDKVITPPFMLLSRPQLGDRGSEVLSKWLTLSQDERRAVSLLASLVSERSVASDLRFLVAVQALEALARVDAREDELTPAEFKRRQKLVVESIDESNVKRWVARKLKYANERAASQLLQDLVASIGEYAAKVAPDQKSLLSDIRDNRNFYTHRDPRRAKRILDGEELYVLTQAVVLLLQAATLRRLGFTPNETSAIMEESQGALQWRFRTAAHYAHALA